jgi:hypothetical protein
MGATAAALNPDEEPMPATQRLLSLCCVAACATAADALHPVTLELAGALAAPGASLSASRPAGVRLHLGRRADGRWDGVVLGWAGFRRDASGNPLGGLYNHMDHEGDAELTEANGGISGRVRLTVHRDPWVPGGELRIELNLQRQETRLGGRFSGTWAPTGATAIPVAGTIAGQVEAPIPRVADFVLPVANEHPRLLFRRSDLPRLRARAATPAGQAMLATLRRQLGGDAALPTARQTAVAAYGPGSRSLPEGAYTLSHALGHGLLWQLTGEHRHAELAREAVELARAGLRDRDQRYAWVRPGGRLRAGWSYYLIAAAYDLCYDAWPAEYRQQLAADILAKVAGGGLPTPRPEAVAALVGGSADSAVAGSGADDDDLALKESVDGDLFLTTGPGQHSPMSNHYGAWIGGGGAALLAIRGDTGVDDALLRRAERIFHLRARRALEAGFGHSGYFFEGHHGGRISLNTGLWQYLAAARQVLGEDLAASYPGGRWLLARHLVELVRDGDTLQAPERGIYAAKTWRRSGQPSVTGDFAWGFAVAPPELLPALLYGYHHSLGATADDYDAHQWPERSVAAFLHWPLDTTPRSPDGLLPRVLADDYANYLLIRSGWRTDGADQVLALRDGNAIALGWGWRSDEVLIPVPALERQELIDDGRAALLRGGTQAALADGSGAAGTPILLAVVHGLPPLTQTAAAAPGDADPMADALRRRFGGGPTTTPRPIPAVRPGGRFASDAADGPAPVPDGQPALSRQQRRLGPYDLTLWTLQRGSAPAATVAPGPDGQPRLHIGRRWLSLEGDQLRCGVTPE